MPWLSWPSVRWIHSNGLDEFEKQSQNPSFPPCKAQTIPWDWTSPYNACIYISCIATVSVSYIITVDILFFTDPSLDSMSLQGRLSYWD